MGDIHTPIPEYTPISHYCDCCGAEVDDDQILFETDPDKWVCEECFERYCHDNLDIYEMAKLWHIIKRKAYMT